eukprot:254818_1
MSLIFFVLGILFQASTVRTVITASSNDTDWIYECANFAECQDEDIICPSNADCTIICSGDAGCYGATIKWPTNGNATILCDGPSHQSCRSVNFPIPPPNKDFTFTCDALNECGHAEIYCPINADCHIICNATKACEYATIHWSKSNTTQITSTLTCGESYVDACKYINQVKLRPTNSSSMLLENIVFDEVTTEYYDDTSMESGWLKIISCREGANKINLFTYYESENIISALFNHTISIKFVPDPSNMSVSKYDEYAVVAKPCSYPIIALNNGKEVSFIIDRKTNAVIDYADISDWIGTDIATQRLLNDCSNGQQYAKDFLDYIYWACGNPDGIVISPSSRMCEWNHLNITGHNINIYLGFHANKTPNYCKHNYNAINNTFFPMTTLTENTDLEMGDSVVETDKLTPVLTVIFGLYLLFGIILWIYFMRMEYVRPDKFEHFSMHPSSFKMRCLMKLVDVFLLFCEYYIAIIYWRAGADKLNYWNSYCGEGSTCNDDKQKYCSRIRAGKGRYTCVHDEGRWFQPAIFAYLGVASLFHLLYLYMSIPRRGEDTSMIGTCDSIKWVFYMWYFITIFIFSFTFKPAPNQIYGWIDGYVLMLFLFIIIVNDIVKRYIVHKRYFLCCLSNRRVILCICVCGGDDDEMNNKSDEEIKKNQIQNHIQATSTEMTDITE